MARYINSYSTAADVQSAIKNDTLSKPYVAYLQDEDRIDWNSYSIDYSTMPLTFKIISGGTIGWKVQGYISSNKIKTIKYSLNGGAWTNLKANGNGNQISVVAGDIIEIKGSISASAVDYMSFHNFNSTATFNAYGNIMSLLFENDFETATTLENAYTFSSMFRACTGLIDASNLVLPVTTLASNCYRQMFDGCTGLTQAPELPATTLAESCYESMFAGCRSLVNAPELPVTTLAYSCYKYMFAGCTSLTTAPELPAETLVTYCYDSMFRNCTNLNYVKCLATTITGDNTYYWMVGTSATGTFVCPQSTDWSTKSQNNSYPSGWTRVNA